MVRRLGSGRVRVVGLLVSLGAQVASAQSLGLPAADPVGIGRSGTGVAFGTSLEAATLNPALLVTLRDARSAYLGAGLEIQKAELTLESTGRDLSSSDRNRLLTAFGAGWRLNDSFAAGLKVDQPFLRHREFPLESSVRFLGRALDLGTRRMELQGAWAMNPHWSLGIGVGLTQVDYASEVVVVTPDSAEHLLRQEGKANALCYTLGLRWAVTPRWTLAGTYQGPIQASPTWSAAYTGNAANVARPGTGKVVLPARYALGVRERVNQFFTWEVDLRYVQGHGLELPTQPYLATAGGDIVPPTLDDRYQNGFGFSAMGEFTWNKRWTLRVGVEILPALAKDATSSPALGGGKSAGLSAGASCKALGGEFSLGYQLRQSMAEESTGIDGVWDAGGYAATGNTLRSKGSGHLLALGYKRAF